MATKNKKTVIELEDLIAPDPSEELVVELEPTEKPIPPGEHVFTIDEVLTEDGSITITAKLVAEPEEPEVDVELTGIASMIDNVTTAEAKPTWLIYGKNGTGKTKLGGTADGALVLAAEDGTLTLRKYPGNRKVLHIKKWKDLEDVYWLLAGGRQTTDGIEIDTKTGKFMVKYLVFDTVTKLAQTCLRSVVLGAAATDPTKDIVSATLRDWGTMSQKMTYWLMQFKDLPVQIVWLMQESSSGEVDDEEFSITIDVNKALRNSLLAEADIIGRTGIIQEPGKATFVVRFTPNPKFVTKDRTGILGNGAYANPSLDKLNEKIEGGLV